MKIALRPLDPAHDFSRVAAMRSQVEPEPISVERLVEWERKLPPETIQHRQVAVGEGGAVLGFNQLWRYPWMPEGRFWLTLVVDRAARRQQIGARLYQAALDYASAQQAGSLAVEVRDDDPQSMSYAERRGFTVKSHIFESTLDLASFDERPYAGAIEALEGAGLRFLSLAELGDTPEARQRLYELNREVSVDVPDYEGDFAPYADFCRFVFGASWYRPEGQLVALDGERWVGMAAVGYFAETNSMYHMITGVSREYRGRKLALALKLLSIRCARKLGASYLRTNNDSNNAPMLAINRKLGYKPEPGFYLMLRELR